MTVCEKGEGVLAAETGAQGERTGGEEETDEPPDGSWGFGGRKGLSTFLFLNRSTGLSGTHSWDHCGTRGDGAGSRSWVQWRTGTAVN